MNIILQYSADLCDFSLHCLRLGLVKSSDDDWRNKLGDCKKDHRTRTEHNTPYLFLIRYHLMCIFHMFLPPIKLHH